MFELVAFDCDGVLVNTEQLSQEFEMLFLKYHGIYLSVDEYMELLCGIPENSWMLKISELLEEKKVDNIANILQGLKNDLDVYIDNNLRLTSDVLTFIQSINIAKCVVSNSDSDRLTNILDRVGLSAYFKGHIFSSQLLGPKKPDPEVYRQICSNYNVIPQKCLVIEDSIPGISSAVNAGCYVVAIVDNNYITSEYKKRLYEAGANEVVTSFSQINLRNKRF
tara:strand:+ start:3763 stop:4428 length:666 start_codon:yes stop_codon:yes gene_type:complete